MSTEITIPVRIRLWRRYKNIVIIPPRGNERKELLKVLSTDGDDMLKLSGSTFNGRLRAILWGEAIEFNVSLRLFAWPIKDLGTELLFLLVGSDCESCVKNIIAAINQYATVRGTLTLYIPQAT